MPVAVAEKYAVYRVTNPSALNSFDKNMLDVLICEHREKLTSGIFSLDMWLPVFRRAWRGNAARIVRLQQNRDIEQLFKALEIRDKTGQFVRMQISANPVVTVRELEDYEKKTGRPGVFLENNAEVFRPTPAAVSSECHGHLCQRETRPVVGPAKRFEEEGVDLMLSIHRQVAAAVATMRTASIELRQAAPKAGNAKKRDARLAFAKRLWNDAAAYEELRLEL